MPTVWELSLASSVKDSMPFLDAPVLVKKTLITASKQNETKTKTKLKLRNPLPKFVASEVASSVCMYIYGTDNKDEAEIEPFARAHHLASLSKV